MAREKRSELNDPGVIPSGTLAFLFTDIEGSTQRWEATREAMQEAVERHEAVVRAAVERHRGYVFKTVGDAFCCAFATAADALGAAVAIQSALGAEDFSAVGGLAVRIGVHVGSAQERDGDYFGPAVNRVARLMSIGHGGQLLLSNAAYELVREAAPANTEFTDLGSHHLKDLTQPERVWQATIAGMSREFSALRSIASYPNNLPLQVTAFFGREDDIDEVKRGITDHHVLTLFGAGGVGKTRLAIQTGAELLERFADGVWIADLAPVNDARSVLSVVAQAVGVDQSRGVLDERVIANWLAPKRLLLILDNSEHVLDPVARLSDVIVRTCADVRLLVTSRQALGVSGEKVFRLPSLSVPPPGLDADPQIAGTYGAVALFVDRAMLANRSFRLHVDNAPLVASICRRLDGIPLALELAAARLRTMSVAGLAQRLDERFKVLTGGNRNALPRQQTLSALIDWSYDLLEQRERSLFDRLAVFVDAFTPRAAAYVCGGDGLEAVDVGDLLCSLAEKSLVLTEAGDEDAYSLLESTRDYACVKLKSSGLSERCKQRYAEYFLRVGLELERAVRTTELSVWLAATARELKHFRAVLEWSLGEGGDAVLGATLATALETYWWHGGVEAEGRHWIDIALALLDPAADCELVARLSQTQARLTSRILFS
jgi:predicted ATPase/class 3 adenylate cyclase